jgi:hypothetical protein
MHTSSSQKKVKSTELCMSERICYCESKISFVGVLTTATILSTNTENIMYKMSHYALKGTAPSLSIFIPNVLLENSQNVTKMSFICCAAPCRTNLPEIYSPHPLFFPSISLSLMPLYTSSSPTSSFTNMSTYCMIINNIFTFSMLI